MFALVSFASEPCARIVEVDPDTRLPLDDKFMAGEYFTLPAEELAAIRERRRQLAWMPRALADAAQAADLKRLAVNSPDA